MDSEKFGTKTNTFVENLTEKEAAKNPMLEMDSDKIVEKTQETLVVFLHFLVRTPCISTRRPTGVYNGPSVPTCMLT